MEKKHLPAFLFILIFSLLVIWLISDDHSNNKVITGFTLPFLDITTLEGKEQIRSDKIHLVTILCFSSACEHCTYELSVIENSPDIFTGSLLYLITSETNYFKSGKHKKWKAIASNSNIKFCIVERNEFESKIESQKTPSFYFFNKDGKLVDKIYGEASTRRIVEGIKLASISQYKTAVPRSNNYEFK